ncbi:hypothetical protein D9M68_677570 [compost metagenome]
MVCRRREKRFAQGARAAQFGNVQRPTGTMIDAGAVGFVVLRTLEIRQHVLVGPARIAKARPMVIVPAITAYIEHRVDRTRATQRLTTWLVADAIIQVPLGHGVECPVVVMGGDHPDEAGWRVDKHAFVRPTRLQQTDRNPTVLTQSARQHAPGGTGSYYHVIELFVTHRSLLSLPILRVVSGRQLPAVPGLDTVVRSRRATAPASRSWCQATARSPG